MCPQEFLGIGNVPLPYPILNSIEKGRTIAYLLPFLDHSLVPERVQGKPWGPQIGKEETLVLNLCLSVLFL